MTIHVVGIGLEGLESLSKSTKIIVQQATVLIGSHRLLSYFPEHPAIQIQLTDFTAIIDQIKLFLEQDHFVVILATGDPLFFGIGRLLLERFSADLLQFYPHINCVQLAFNRLKIPYQDAAIVSVHGRDLTELTSFLQKGVKKLAILTDNINHPPAIAQFYLNLALPCYYHIFVCENLGSSSEEIVSFIGRDISILAQEDPDKFSSLNVVIFLRNFEDSKKLEIDKLSILGLKDTDFFSFEDRPSLMTKKEIRTLILGELKLQNYQVVWDIGSGTGSVAIEIARLCPDSQVYAIEKTAMGICLIEKNCQQFQVKNIIPVQAYAPNELDILPFPHRIFLGGTGGNMIQLLDFCQDRIEDNGIIVIALATLENQAQCLTWFQENSWDYQVLMVQISRSVPVANLTRLSPLNPITLITAQRHFT